MVASGFRVLLSAVGVAPAVCGAAPPLRFLRTTPDPGVVVEAPAMLHLEFNQPVMEGEGDLLVECGTQRFSASVRSPHAWVGRGASTQFGATVTVLLPAMDGNCTAFVPAGAYVGAAQGSPSPNRRWAFSIGRLNRTEPVLPKALKSFALPQLDRARINATIAHLAYGYENRFFAAASGAAAADWLKKQYEDLARSAGRSDVRVEKFEHAWQMPSLVIRIPGQEAAAQTVIVGAHLDTINRQNWTVNLWTGRAPGANDDGSAIAVQLEVFRQLLAADFRPQRTVELHAYSGEEEGLYGSADVSAAYARSGREVAAMLQLDQCGYVSDPLKPRIAVYTDNTDRALSAFLTRLIDAYCSVPWEWSDEEHRADSDFHSWHDHGFPAAYAAEGPVDDIVYGNNKHSAGDELAFVDLGHVLEFGRLMMGFLLELALPSPPAVLYM